MENLIRLSEQYLELVIVSVFKNASTNFMLLFLFEEAAN
jgi:hypothetical protein